MPNRLTIALRLALITVSRGVRHQVQTSIVLFMAIRSYLAIRRALGESRP